MSQKVEEQMSAFLDGELPDEELDLLLARLDRDPEGRRTLGRYSMIGECLRTGDAHPGAVTVVEAVRARLGAEATGSVALERESWRGWAAGGLAAACALVAVLVAGPQAWRTPPAAAAGDGLAAARLLDEPPAPVRSLASHRVNPGAAARLTGYLVAHGEYANQLSRSNFDSHLISARAERASWRQTQELTDAP